MVWPLLAYGHVASRHDRAPDMYATGDSIVDTKPALPLHRYRTREAAAALVEEAIADFPPKAGLSMRSNAVRLVAGMWFITGSLHFPRGWVTAAMKAFMDHGVACPNAKCWRWYRSAMSQNPMIFANSPCVPVELLEQMDHDQLAED